MEKILDFIEFLLWAFLFYGFFMVVLSFLELVNYRTTPALIGIFLVYLAANTRLLQNAQYMGIQSINEAVPRSRVAD